MRTATSSAVFFRSLGGSLGVAVLGSIFNARLATAAARSSHVLHGVVNLASGSIALSPAQVRHLPPAAHAAVVGAFAQGLHGVFVTLLPMALAIVPVLLILREIPLRQTAHVGSVPEATASVPAQSAVNPAPH